MRATDPDDLRRLFAEKLAHIDAPSVHGTELRRRVRRRRLGSLGAIASLVIGAAVVSFLGIQELIERNTRPAQPSLSHEPTAPGSESIERRKITPTFQIGSGVKSGDAWSLEAYLEETEGRKALCVIFDAEVDSGGACYVNIQQGLGGNHIQRGWGWGNPDSVPFYGVISPEVKQLVLKLEDQSQSLADLYPSPPGLETSLQFFSVFAPPRTDVTLVAKDVKGNVLEAQAIRALPLLTVSKTGSGSGTVVGNSTEELLCRKECSPPRRWIDCGANCTAEVDNQRLTLTAIPEEGSQFAEWGGACTGLVATCRVLVDDDLSVTAKFEAVP